MKSLLTLLVFYSVCLSQTCEKPIITEKPDGLHFKYLICDSLYGSKILKEKLQQFDDSKALYKEAVAAKWAGIGAIIGVAAVIVPISMISISNGNTYGYYLNTTILLPALIFNGIKSHKLKMAIQTYNAHF